MFEPPVVDVSDTVVLADRLDASVEEELRRGAEQWALVAAWADHHPVLDEAEVDPSWTRHRRRTSTVTASYGAEGTPAVSEYAAMELGCLLRTTTASAALLLRDVLDVRHRLPGHWVGVMTGRIEPWKARKIARLTTELPLQACLEVDRVTVTKTIGLPFGRAAAAVEAAVIAVDPVDYEERRTLEAERRYVSMGRPSDRYGLRTMIARTDPGTITRMNAMVAHLAGLLEAAGDTDPVQVRRAKAFGILANPALACVFLAHAHPSQPPSHTEAQTEAQTGPAAEPEPDAEPEPEPEEPAEPSAVELAVLFGQALQSLGTKAVDRLRPTSVLYLHLAQEAVQGIAGTQVARVEGIGPIGVEQLREWLGTDKVTVRGVLDPLGQPALDSYEVRGDLREAVQLTHPFEIFPWGTLVSRKADKDHTIPYVPPDEGGPPGQTRLDNLGPLGRGHHNAKTEGAFTCHQLLPGMFLWRTPTGHWYQVDNQGTHPLGRETPAILRQQAGEPGFEPGPDPGPGPEPAPLSPMEAHFTRILRVA